MAINVEMTDINIPYKTRHREPLILSPYALLTSNAVYHLFYFASGLLACCTNQFTNDSICLPK